MEGRRVEGGEIVLEEDRPQCRVIDALRIMDCRRAVDDEGDGDVGAAVQEDMHAVAGHVAVRPAGEDHPEGIAGHVDADGGHADLGKADHAGRGDPVFLVVDPHPLARHDPGAENVAAAHRLAGHQLDHLVVHVLVRTEFDRLIFAVIVDDAGVGGPAVTGHEEIEKTGEQPVLQEMELLPQPPAIEPLVRLQHRHQLRAALVDVLVLQVLGVSQDVGLAEQTVGGGHVVVPPLGEHRPPAAAGDVGKTDVVGGAVAAGEIRHPERPVDGQIIGEITPQRLEVGRVEAEGERPFLGDEEVGLERVPDHQQTAAEDGPAELVEKPAAGIEILDQRLCLGQHRGIAIGIGLRVEAGMKEPHQLQGDFRMVVERPRHPFQIVAVRVGMGEAGVAETDEGADQRAVRAADHPVGDHLVVGERGHRHHLGGVHLRPQLLEQRAVLGDQPAVFGGDVKRREEVGVVAVMDGQAVGALDSQAQAAEGVDDLQQVPAVGRIGDPEQQPRFRPADPLALLHRQTDPAERPAAGEEPQQPGDPDRRRGPDVFRIVVPQEPEQRGHLIDRKILVPGPRLLLHRQHQIRRHVIGHGGRRQRAGPIGEGKLQHLERVLGSRHVAVGGVDLGIGDRLLRQGPQGVMHGPRHPELGDNQVAVVVGQDEPPVAFEEMQVGGENRHRLDIFAVAGKEIGMHPGLQPAEVRLRHLDAFPQDVLNLGNHPTVRAVCHVVTSLCCLLASSFPQHNGSNAPRAAESK